VNRCRVRLAQINPTLGDLHHNLELHRREVQAARAAGVQLLVFPELSLSGYFLKDQVTELATTLEGPELQALIGLSGELSIAVGFVERAHGDVLYNSVAFLERGEVRHVHRKVHLVSYGMFDEERDFAAGARFAAFESRHGRFGILTCEDLWHLPGPYLYFLDEVDVLLVCSASPARGVSADGAPGLRSVRTWNRLCGACATLTQSYLLYSNRVGFEDGVAFGGGSAVYGPDGDRLGRLEGLDPGHLDAELDGRELSRVRLATPLRRDERPWILRDDLARRDGDGRLGS
jgi:predicted amidohydrolase